MDESEAKSQEIDHPETESNSDHSSAVKDLLARTGYKLETFPSSRVYGGPPPDFTGDEPKEECQVLQRNHCLCQEFLIRVKQNIQSKYSDKDFR